MKLPYDLAGSISKNRFRVELIWGLKKMIDLYQKEDDYTVVFDYCCDVEVHLNETFEFYQVKSQNNNGSYTINKLVKPDKTGKSVLGKVYILKFDENDNENEDIIVAVVSNAPLKDCEKMHSDATCVNLATIPQKSIDQIKDKIKVELGLSKEIKMENSFFIRTTMDLTDPQHTIIGELVTFFEDVLDVEVKKVKSLYNVLFSEINERACYEKKIVSYEELVHKKGISKSKFNKILSKYIDNTDIAIEKAKDYIDSNFHSFKERITLNKSLSNVFLELKSNKILKIMEIEIAECLKRNFENLPDDENEIINLVYKMRKVSIPIEMSDSDLRALIILVLKRFEEGLYE
jgi:hypothetical protein